MRYCNIEHVKVLDNIRISKSIQDWKYGTESDCLAEEDSMTLLVALLLMTVSSSQGSAFYKGVRSGPNISLKVL